MIALLIVAVPCVFILGFLAGALRLNSRHRNDPGRIPPDVIARIRRDHHQP